LLPFCASEVSAIMLIKMKNKNFVTAVFINYN
jgi:hypothetical protein